MSLRFFQIPVRRSPDLEEELNGFLQSNRVLSIERRFVDQGPESFWAICVDYLPIVHGQDVHKKRSDGKKPRVDYREVLPPEQFSIYVKLRELRQLIAQEESVPVYTIFTNEQLAAMIQKSVTNRTELSTIPGIGDARLAKYSDRFLSILNSNHAPGESPF